MKFATMTLRFCLCCVVLIVASVAVRPQSDDEAAKAIIVKALTLYQQQRYAEALPYMEQLAKAAPESAQIRHAYGFCLLAKSKQINNPDEAKQLSAKALEQFLKAKELGLKTPENETLIGILSGKVIATPDAPAYSMNKEADKLMVEGESLFAESKYDEAIKNYEKALMLDPTIYQAALSGGDSYTAKSDWANAEKWYQRGITINPNRETAYRYSGTPLMKQNKYDLARERYIEAYITEPYNAMSQRGITQWADITGAKLNHPELGIPEIRFDANGKAILATPIDQNDASSRPWLAYTATREAWKKEKFAKAFPKETGYRHSLQEEAAALRAVIAAGADQKSPSQQLRMLTKMDSDGVLEAYILMAAADEDISADHPEFLKTNRPKLRQYVANYVISK